MNWTKNLQKCRRLSRFYKRKNVNFVGVANFINRYNKFVTKNQTIPRFLEIHESALRLREKYSLDDILEIDNFIKLDTIKKGIEKDFEKTLFSNCVNINKQIKKEALIKKASELQRKINRLKTELILLESQIDSLG